MFDWRRALLRVALVSMGVCFGVAPMLVSFHVACCVAGDAPAEPPESDHEHVGATCTPVDVGPPLSHALLRNRRGSALPLDRYLHRSRCGICVGVAAGLVLRCRPWA